MNPKALLVQGLSDIMAHFLETHPEYVEKKLDVKEIQNDFMKQFPMFEHDENVIRFIPNIIGIEYCKKKIESE